MQVLSDGSMMSIHSRKKMKMESFLILGRIKLIIGDLSHLILEESLSGKSILSFGLRQIMRAALVVSRISSAC